MKREAEKCQPLCKFCHRLKSHAERMEEKEARTSSYYSSSYHAVKLREYKERNREYVNKKKLDAGECMVCKREVTPETFIVRV